MTTAQKIEKLALLISEYGYDNVHDMVQDYISESVVPGICTNPDCECSYEYEPDSSEGFCECCKTNTVSSLLVLADLM